MAIDYLQLDELHRWMVDNSVLEVEVAGVRMKLAESAIPLEHPEANEDEGDAPPEARPVTTFESLRAAARKAQ